jgi:glutamate N-acetyltransferase/amino-acid N-acetyltransferase
MTRRLVSSQLPRGFSFAAAACGLKRCGLDLTLLASERPAAAAAVFTTNRVQAAPVRLSREHVRQAAARMRAIVVNSGNANCSTGPAGLAAARATAAVVARELGCRAAEILVGSTGVIGVPMRAGRILRALPALVGSRTGTASAFASVTRAIMTTDTRPKWAAARVRIGGKPARLLGCAKGAGMIHPQMATMLAFILTDAAVAPALLQRALREAVRGTFNSITVDGDTSTNDTVAVLANGSSGAPAIRAVGADYESFTRALESVCRHLALAIVADGEGARRVVEIEVGGALNDRAAQSVARAIATSPLVKTALAGADPNWGRILAAAGRAPLPKNAAFNPDRARIWLAGTLVCRRGCAAPFRERTLHRKLLARYVPVVVSLGAGRGRARIWTCDFTGDYVKINASYRS